MPLGAYRHQVTLDVPDGAGFQPLDPATWYCAVQADAIVGGPVLLTGPFHPGITTATRVHFKGRVYHVVSLVSREERDVEMILNCAEVFD